MRKEIRLRFPVELALWAESDREGERGGSSAGADPDADVPDGAVVEEGGEEEEEEGEEGEEAATGWSLSAGCRSGSEEDDALASLERTSMPSLKPISPRFRGRGPAWGRGASSSVMCATADVVAATVGCACVCG